MRSLLPATGCRRDRSLGQGSVSSKPMCPELGLRYFSGHQGFQHRAFEPFAPMPWEAGAPLALPQWSLRKCMPEIFCKLGSELLQNRLFASLLGPSSFGPCGGGEVGSGALCRPDPITDGDFGERQDLSCQTTLHQQSAQTAFAAGTGKGRGCGTKEELLHTYHTQIFAVAAGTK